MEKVRRFFRELNEKRSYQIVFFVVSMCVVLGLYAGVKIKIQLSKAHEYTVVEDNNLIRFIEGIHINKGRLVIDGWSFYKDADSNKTECQIFLRNLDNKKDVIWLDTEKVARKDINNYFDCEYDYSAVGFEASTKLSKLDIESENYEIFIKLTYKKSYAIKTEYGEQEADREYKKTVSAGQYILGGNLTASRLIEKSDGISILSETMSEIIEKGHQLAYIEDGDMYIYQCQNKLYLIAGEDAYFEEDGRTVIDVSSETTRVDKLPSERIENNWNWDNLSFVFEQYEITDEQCTPYRISILELPESYPIAYLGIGYRLNSQLMWEEYLTPDITVFVK